MKKIKKMLRFLIISIICLIAFLAVFRSLFIVIWHFDILSSKSYRLIAEYWERGGVFNTARDYSLGAALIILPIAWLISSYKLYKFGLVKFLLLPIVKTYKKITRPKNMEVEHVKIKNLRAKSKTIDEIISERIKEKGEAHTSNKVSRNLREQISAKIEEN